MQEINEDVIQKIISYCKLEEEQSQTIKQYINRCKIQRLMIRDTLSQQGKTNRQAYFLLEGQVNIIASLCNGQKTVLNQVGKGEILNLQIIMNDWVNKYSIIVASSFISFITFHEKQVRIMTSLIIPQITQKATLKQRQLNKRNKQVKDKSKKKKMQQNINKLILPDINLHPTRKKTLIYSQGITTQIKPKESNKLKAPIFSKQLKYSNRSSSLGHLRINQARYAEPQTLEQKNMKILNDNILRNFKENKNTFLQRKLQRLQSERSISLNEKELKQYDYSRNDKLFKEQLKNIVRRKIMFERKHFKILNNFKNEEKVQHLEDSEAIKRYEDDNNPIDNYFIL